MSLKTLAHLSVWRKYSYRLPLLTFLLSLLAGIMIFLLCSWQHSQLAVAEAERLGRALGSQLAETIRQPIMLNDLVSLQAGVENLAKNTDVVRATVLDTTDNILAERVKSEFKHSQMLYSHRTKITIDGMEAAYAEVDINRASIQQRNSQPLDWALSIWMVFTLTATSLAALQGRNLSRRIAYLTQRLPQEEAPEAIHTTPDDEFADLEQQLEPLLSPAINPEQPSSEPSKQVAIVALHCKNLERLQAQLTQENLQCVLGQLDRNLEQVASLYFGKRVSSRSQTLFVEFQSDNSEDDHPLRALFCASILQKLATQHAESLGVELELAAAVSLHECHSDNVLLTEFELEARQTQAIRLAQLSASGETLADHATCHHSSIINNVTVRIFSENPPIYTIEGFSSVYSSLLKKQLHYLSSP